MSSQIARELNVNITTTNTWTQLKNQYSAAVYAAPSASANDRAEISTLAALNLGSNSVTVEFAISTDNTITDAEMLVPKSTLTSQYETLEDNHRHVLPAGFGLWARAVGTTPNVTFRATILEVNA